MASEGEQQSEQNEQNDSSKGRLLLVSNRLPITIKRSDEGKFDFSMSSGGLVSGLSGLAKSTTFQWYGWPGIEIPEDEVPKLKQQLKDEYNAVPIMLDDELADRHYNGFSSTYRKVLAGCKVSLTWHRRDPLASVALPPRRIDVRRVSLGSVPRSQQALREGHRQRRQ